MSRFREKLKKLTELDMLKAMKDTLRSGYTLFKGKLKDYSAEPIKELGAIGIYLRMKEKFGRLDNLLRSDEASAYESIKDNINDVFILGAVLMALLERDLADVDKLRKQYRMLMGDDGE